jgi:hypothetical protein
MTDNLHFKPRIVQPSLSTGQKMLQLLMNAGLAVELPPNYQDDPNMMEAYERGKLDATDAILHKMVEVMAMSLETWNKKAENK